MAQPFSAAAAIKEKEPNNIWSEAQSVQIEVEVQIALSKKGDKDYFAVIAPSDGVIRLQQLAKSKTHGWLYPWWMVDDKKFTRGGEWDKPVKAGENVVFGLRSAQNEWNEAASDEVISVKVTFEPVTTHEPDNDYETALPIELSTPFKVQINPRRDRDFRTFISPGRGFVTLKQAQKSKTHGYLYPWWMVDGKKFTRAGEWTYAVQPQQKVVFGLRSSQNEWNETASKEVVALTVIFTPEISPHEPNDSFSTAEKVSLGEPFKLIIAPRLDRDYFKVTAPASGTIKLRQITKSNAHRSVYPVWMKDEKNYFRGGQWDRSVRSGESIVFRITSAQNEWNEVSSPEQIQLLLSFTPEDAGAEPNNTTQQAKLVAIDVPFEFQLNPTGDWDYFKIIPAQSGILSLSRLDQTKAHSQLRFWWGEDEDRREIAPQVSEKRVMAGVEQILAFRSAQNRWNEIGSDAKLKFKLEMIEDADTTEPNNDPEEARAMVVNKPFSYIIQPANDQDYFIVSAPDDGVLIVRTQKNKALNHPANWQEVGSSEPTKTSWIKVKKGRQYLLKIDSNQTGKSNPTPHQAIILHGTAKEFNLVKPIPKKRWTFDIQVQK